MIEIRVVTQANQADLNLKNEPFQMPGRLIPSLKDGVWDYRVEWFDEAKSLCFPDENYDFEQYSKDGFILGAYEGDKCLGIGIFRDTCWKYSYLYDLKVCADYRRKGIGRALMDAGMAEAKARGYRGLYLVAQDDNLNACLFYLACGFEIGGFDNHVYNFTSQEGKADIIFYKQ